jgi:hypothetical protein
MTPSQGSRSSGSDLRSPYSNSFEEKSSPSGGTVPCSGDLAIAHRGHKGADVVEAVQVTAPTLLGSGAI